MANNDWINKMVGHAANNMYYENIMQQFGRKVPLLIILRVYFI
jgi:hypothetical protein